MNTAIRVIFRCKNCGTTEAHEYLGGARIVPGTTTWAKGSNGQPISCNDDERCPACRRFRKLSTVKGRYSDKHTCGAKCVNAIGPACECSCAGANHGAGYMS